MTVDTPKPPPSMAASAAKAARAGAARLDTPDVGIVHPALGVHVVFLSVSRADEVYVRVVLECHEGIGVARAHDTTTSSERTLLSLLVVPDFAADARALLIDLAHGADVEFLASDAQWIEQVVRELE